MAEAAKGTTTQATIAASCHHRLNPVLNPMSHANAADVRIAVDMQATAMLSGALPRVRSN
jgi:hypothetical protein